MECTPGREEMCAGDEGGADSCKEIEREGDDPGRGRAEAGRNPGREEWSGGKVRDGSGRENREEGQLKGFAGREEKGDKGGEDKGASSPSRRQIRSASHEIPGSPYIELSTQKETQNRTRKNPTRTVSGSRIPGSPNTPSREIPELHYSNLSTQEATPTRKNPARAVSGSRIPGSPSTPTHSKPTKIVTTPTKSKTPKKQNQKITEETTLKSSDFNSDTDTASETEINEDEGFDLDFMNTTRPMERYPSVEEGDDMDVEGEEYLFDSGKKTKDKKVTKMQKMKSKKDKLKTGSRDLYEDLKRKKAMIHVKLTLLGDNYHCKKEECLFQCHKSDQFAALKHANIEDCLKKKTKKAHKVVVECLENKEEGGKCGVEFNSKVKLRQHYQLVHQKMVHRCNKCPKEFKGRKYLMAHMITKHDTLTPQKCKDCEKFCLGERDLLFHVKRVHSTHLTEEDVNKQFENLLEKKEPIFDDWEELLSSAKILVENKTGDSLLTDLV